MTQLKVLRKAVIPVSVWLSLAYNLAASGFCLLFCGIAGMALLGGHPFAAVALCGIALLICWFTVGEMLQLSALFVMCKELPSGNVMAIARAYSSALRTVRALHLNHSVTYLYSMANYGLMLMLTGDFDRAELLMRETMGLIDKKQEEQDAANRPHILLNLGTKTGLQLPRKWQETDLAANLYNDLATLLVLKGDLAQAEGWAKGALKIYQAEDNKTDVAYPKIVLGWIRLERNEHERAEQYLTEALDLCGTGKLPQSMTAGRVEEARTNCMLNLARAFYMHGKDAEASVLCDDLLKRLSVQKLLLTTSLCSLSRLADELIVRKDFKRAEQLLEYAYALAGRFPDHPHASLVIESYSQLLLITDRQSELADLKSWIRPVLLGLNG